MTKNEASQNIYTFKKKDVNLTSGGWEDFFLDVKENPPKLLLNIYLHGSLKFSGEIFGQTKIQFLLPPSAPM